ncbi:MAG: hypothetical protein J6Y02_12640 [Pseudobutyrivibrio sp.]|nr:hypothetical protein [Pseudobutyrivibrio sp.]
MKNNQQKFVEVFGEETFDRLISVIMHDEDSERSSYMLKWLFKQYIEADPQCVKAYEEKSAKLITDHYKDLSITKEVEMLSKIKKGLADAAQMQKSNAPKVRRFTYDHIWYEKYVSDFVSSNKKSVPFNLSDDKSMNPGNSVHALRNRFEKAIAYLGYSDTVKIRRIAQNSPNAYIVIENKRVKVDNGRADIYKHNTYAKHSTTWYDKAIEDFYLSGERSKCFKLIDDKTACPAPSLDSLKYRLAQAAERAGILDDISVHRYYKGTCNECVMVENVSAEKKFIGSYKLS